MRTGQRQYLRTPVSSTSRLTILSTPVPYMMVTSPIATQSLYKQFSWAYRMALLLDFVLFLRNVNPRTPSEKSNDRLEQIWRQRFPLGSVPKKRDIASYQIMAGEEGLKKKKEMKLPCDLALISASQDKQFSLRLPSQGP